MSSTTSIAVARPAKIAGVIPTNLYQPLNADRNEIRLLRIVPSFDMGKICCELEVASLDTYLFYRALSYEWGEQDDRRLWCGVHINSHEVSTTPNLRLALAHLDQNAWYWIDALCINQSDDIERSQQVRLMTRIYQTAYAVDVWLGVNKGNSHLGIELLNQFESRFTEVAKTQEKGRTSKVLQELSDPKYDNHWDGFCQLLSRSYWRRLWVIQEIVVTPRSERVSLHCGPRRGLFHLIGRMIGGIDELANKTTVMDLNPSLTWASLSRRIRAASLLPYIIHQHAESWKNKKSKERAIGLLRLLGDYNGQNCSEPRDKVYALLGVSLSYKEAELEISYSLPIPEVYKSAAQYIIQGSQRLEILLYCGKLPTDTYKLPSWVPNWIAYDSQAFTIRRHDNCWDAAKGFRAKVNISEDCSILSATAIILGSITRLCDCSDKFRIIPREVRYGDPEPVSMDVKREIFKWLRFTVSCLQDTDSLSFSPDDKEGIAGSEATIRAFYQMLSYTRYGKRKCDELIPLEVIGAFCRKLYAAGINQLSESKWPHMRRRHFFHTIEGSRVLCEIKSNNPNDDISTNFSQLNIGKPEKNLAIPKTSVGMCLPAARLGDVPAIIGGCRHPVLLRPKGEHYQLVGEIFVHGVMSGEAVGKFPEVRIKLI
jgi:hypothetical protein